VRRNNDCALRELWMTNHLRDLFLQKFAQAADCLTVNFRFRFRKRFDYQTNVQRNYSINPDPAWFGEMSFQQSTFCNGTALA
jgi:hypothetical protein